MKMNTVIGLLFMVAVIFSASARPSESMLVLSAIKPQYKAVAVAISVSSVDNRLYCNNLSPTDALKINMRGTYV